MALPSFTHDGLLPPGTHLLTIQELSASVLVNGPGGDNRDWDVDRRRRLVANLSRLTSQLVQVGIYDVFVNGSFAEEKDHPNDIDDYFACDALELPRLQRELNLLDPHKVWTWNRSDRTPYRPGGKPQLPMWHHSRVELYPHYGQFSGIFDEFGNELVFPAAFRKSRHRNKPKGIVQLHLGGPT